VVLKPCVEEGEAEGEKNNTYNLQFGSFLVSLAALQYTKNKATLCHQLRYNQQLHLLLDLLCYGLDKHDELFKCSIRCESLPLL